MPGMSGYEVLQRIKASIPDLPVIMISAVGELKSLIDCIEHGAEDYFLKPFEPALLRTRISAALKRNRHASIEEASPSAETNGLQQIAREIKTPLGFILNSVELAADTLQQLRQAFGQNTEHIEDLFADLRQSLAMIHRQSAKATQAMERILDPQGQ